MPPRSIVDDFLDGLAEYAREFIHESIDAQLNGTPEARAPRSRRATIKPPKPPKAKKAKAERPAKRERAEPTLYDVLEVSPKASRETIEAAYKSLARRFHPDTNKSKQAEERMKKLNHAKDILFDPVKRHTYDRGMGL